MYLGIFLRSPPKTNLLSVHFDTRIDSKVRKHNSVLGKTLSTSQKLVTLFTCTQSKNPVFSKHLYGGLS